jgi:hypothetical protein
MSAPGAKLPSEPSNGRSLFEEQLDVETVWRLPEFNSLIRLEYSLFLELFSLLISVGKYFKAATGTAVSAQILSPQPLKLRFPCKIPC